MVAMSLFCIIVTCAHCQLHKALSSMSPDSYDLSSSLSCVQQRGICVSGENGRDESNNT